MFRVVHIITQLELGGAQENTLYTCEHLDRNRFTVSLIHGGGGLLDDWAERIGDLENLVVPSLIRFLRPKTDLACLVELTRTLRRIRREHAEAGHDPVRLVVHTHSSKAGILGRLAARAAGVPLTVHTIHGFGFFEGQAPLRFQTFLSAERFVSRFTDAFIGVSRANLAEARSRGIIRSGQKVALIRSGFDLSTFAEVDPVRVDALRKELAVEEDAEVVLSVANLKSQKDPLTMVLAMAELCKRRPRTVLLYAGDGPMRASIERAIEQHGLQSRFRLLGWRTDIPELMALSDVVALSSRYEGLPRVCVQALAARRPFVGTRVDGTPEVIREGRNGFLVEPRSPAALARALERALELRPVDEEDRRRIQEWDADEMVRAQERLYEELTDRAERPR